MKGTGFLTYSLKGNGGKKIQGQRKQGRGEKPELERERETSGKGWGGEGDEQACGPLWSKDLAFAGSWKGWAGESGNFLSWGPSERR